MSDGGFMKAPRGPIHLLNQPIKVLGLDMYSSIGILPIVIFPFAPVSWILAVIILIAITIANYYNLPSYQLFRYFRVKLGPSTLPPHVEQLDREKWSARRWPY